MRVAVASRSFFAKILASTFLAMTLSLSAQAMGQQQKVEKIEKEKVDKKVDKSIAKTPMHAPQQCGKQVNSTSSSAPCQDQSQAQNKAPLSLAKPSKQLQTAVPAHCCDTSDEVSDSSSSSSESGALAAVGLATCSTASTCTTSLAQGPCGALAPGSTQAPCGALQAAATTQCAQNCSPAAFVDPCPSSLLAMKPCILGATITLDACQIKATQNRPLHKMIGINRKLENVYAKGELIGKKNRIRNWSGSTFNGVLAEEIKWHHVDMYDSTLNNVHIKGSLRRFRFDNSTITNTTFEGGAQNNIFADVDFRSARLYNVRFDNINFAKRQGRRSNFDQASLENVEFNNSLLDKVTFYGAYLKNVWFPLSFIERHAKFKHAKVYACGGYMPLSGTILKQMGAYMRLKKEGRMNMSAYFDLVDGCH